VRNQWYKALITAQGAGLALSGAGGSNNIGTTPTSLLPGQAKWPLEGQFIDMVGEKLRVRAAGILTTPASPSSVALSVYFDAIAVWSSGAITPSANLTNATWALEVDLDARLVGSGTAAALFGVAIGSGALSGAFPATSPANGSGFDSTLPHVVDFYVTLGAATSGETIQLVQYELASVL
jgi:hypothetical protein